MEIKKGISFTSTVEVTQAMSALSVGSGDMEVLATPMMIALMENAAMLCIKEHLEEGQTTVGILIESTHSRATAVGKRIEAMAIVTEVDGRKITFEVVAKDDKGVIGSAKHERFIVERAKFLSRL